MAGAAWCRKTRLRILFPKEGVTCGWAAGWREYRGLSRAEHTHRNTEIQVGFSGDTSESAVTHSARTTWSRKGTGASGGIIETKWMMLPAIRMEVLATI